MPQEIAEKIQQHLSLGVNVKCYHQLSRIIAEKISDLALVNHSNFTGQIHSLSEKYFAYTYKTSEGNQVKFSTKILDIKQIIESDSATVGELFCCVDVDKICFNTIFHTVNGKVFAAVEEDDEGKKIISINKIGETSNNDNSGANNTTNKNNSECFKLGAYFLRRPINFIKWTNIYETPLLLIAEIDKIVVWDVKNDKTDSSLSHPDRKIINTDFCYDDQYILVSSISNRKSCIDIYNHRAEHLFEIREKLNERAVILSIEGTEGTKNGDKKKKKILLFACGFNKNQQDSLQVSSGDEEIFAYTMIRYNIGVIF
jgi:hypothetical protein